MVFSEQTKLEAKRRSHFRCCICRMPFIEVHHIIPKSKRGGDNIKNAAPLCASCHDLYGGNPDKRKQIREMRDQWWSLMAQREELIFTNQNLEISKIEPVKEPHKRLRKKAIALYHVVFKDENFEKSADIIYDLVKYSQIKAPNAERHLFLDIEGHKNKKGGYDQDMFELQKDFILGFLLKYLTKASMPLIGAKNKKQTNDIPEKLMIFASKKEAKKFKSKNEHVNLKIFRND